MPLYHSLRSLLFRLDAERAHLLVTGMGTGLATLPGARAALRGLFGYEHEALHQRVWERTFANPVGLAAGFDKDATLMPLMAGLGFGLLEVGTVTPRPQPGNPLPRLFRLPQDVALINRMGFNNAGVKALTARLQTWRAHTGAAQRPVVGVNLGKNKDTPLEQATDDYLACLQAVYPHADYLVVNVSSPNTPGLRTLQGRAELGRMAAALADARAQRTAAGEPRVPLLIKLAPELDEGGLGDVVAVALEHGFDGLIATNTTLSREGLRGAAREETGGLSGRPLHGRAVAVVAALHRLSEGRLPLVGVGGVFGPDDAYDLIKAGASLVQVYTGLIYEGPGLVKRIKQGLVRRLQRDGLRSVADAVGVGA